MRDYTSEVLAQEKNSRLLHLYIKNDTQMLIDNLHLRDAILINRHRKWQH